MTTLRSRIFPLVVVSILTLSGCSGSSSSSSSDPLAGKTGQPPTGDPPPPTGTGTVLNYTLSLTTVGSSGSTTVGANSTVIATATLKDSSGKPVANQPVKFEEIAITDSTVSIPTPVVSTSSEGIATSLLQIASSNVNRDVIIKASTTVSDQEVSSESIFKIVRSAGNYIDFISTKDPTDPDGNLNHIEVTVSNLAPTSSSGLLYRVLQLVPVQVLDKNDQNRTSVPLTLQLENALGCTVNLHDEFSQTETVVTDDTGLAVFSAIINMPIPAVGADSGCAIVYKATTFNPYSTAGTLFSYGAYTVKLSNVKQ